MNSENIPVIIGAGQVTKREASSVQGGSPIDLMAAAVKIAAEDGGVTEKYLQQADLLMTTSLFSDDGIANPPGCVADKLNLTVDGYRRIETGESAPDDEQIAKLNQLMLWFGICFFEMALEGLRSIFGFGIPISQLEGSIPIGLLGLHLRHNARTCFNDGTRHTFASAIVHTGHANLFTNQSVHHFLI